MCRSSIITLSVAWEAISNWEDRYALHSSFPLTQVASATHSHTEVRNRRGYPACLPSVSKIGTITNFCFQNQFSCSDQKCQRKFRLQCHRDEKSRNLVFVFFVFNNVTMNMSVECLRNILVQMLIRPSNTTYFIGRVLLNVQYACINILATDYLDVYRHILVV